MPDEEEKFTFVDKRGQSAAETVVDTDGDNDLEDVVGDEIDLGAGEDPLAGVNTTYQLALYALGMLQMNAFQQLGLIADQQTGKAVRDLAQARVAIDCVAALVEVVDTPQSELDAKMRGDIRRVVTDLRLNFVTQTQLAGSGN